AGWREPDGNVSVAADGALYNLVGSIRAERVSTSLVRGGWNRRSRVPATPQRRFPWCRGAVVSAYASGAAGGLECANTSQAPWQFLRWRARPASCCNPVLRVARCCARDVVRDAWLPTHRLRRTLLASAQVVRGKTILHVSGGVWNPRARGRWTQRRTI